MVQRLAATLFIVSIMSCNDTNQNQPGEGAGKTDSARFAAGTFGFDKDFLQSHDSTLITLSAGESSILVSPRYQAKVFTSTAAGNSGKSFGWINYKAFDAPINPHMNAYGGENRLWLGPEGGPWSLFFKPGDSMVFDNWKTPAPIDTESWQVGGKSNNSVTLLKEMQLTNYTGATLSLAITRTVVLLTEEQIAEAAGVAANEAVKAVGYATNNVLVNMGKEAWTEKTGMPCIWVLDMFNPSPATTIVIPYKAAANEKVATTGYFGEIPPDRIRLNGKTLFFKADGKQRGKLGILPEYVTSVAGSYDAENNVLTITLFSYDNKGRYLNQEWTTLKPIFSGDAMNAYNDGPLANGDQMGPFYEIESVSPAAALKPGEQLVHSHSVFHFTGSKQQLNAIAQKMLGESLETIEQAFK